MVRVVLCNCSPGESAGLARRLVDAGLAACVNIIPGVVSVYRWQGERCEDQEHTLVIKTSADRYDELEGRLAQWHSYDVPEIIALEATDVLDAYGAWVHEQTKRSPDA